MPAAKKLIEVALPLDAINAASAREKSIRHGHPSTLHLWWSRKPLATTRAVIFASLVDDPDDPNANPAFVAACRDLPGDGPNVAREGDSPRMKLFDFIERLVTWEATTDETIMSQARQLIRIATNGEPPPLLDPFAGGGSIPLEAQRLGLEAHASDLNPVAVMINKAMIEIPPRFAGMPPVNPRDRKQLFPPTPNPSPHKEGRGLTSAELAPPCSTSLMNREGELADVETWDVSPELERKMQQVARELRRNPTEAEDRLWQAIRKRQVLGKKFRRQMPIGAFVVDFYCSSERLALEVDGGVHDSQIEAGHLRQELIESLGIRFLRLTNDEVMRDLPGAIDKIEQALENPHPKPLPHKEGRGLTTAELVDKSPLPSSWGKGPGDGGWKGAAGLAADVRYYGQWMRERAFERIGHLYPQHNGETVIAWLWARTVTCPNPACRATMPLVSSMHLSKKKGKRAWLVAHPDLQAKRVRFEVKRGEGNVPDPPKLGRGARFKCLTCNETATAQYLKDEGMAGRMDAQLTAIVTQGTHGRNYHPPTAAAEELARSAKPEWLPVGEIPDEPRAIWCKLYGLLDFADLFTPRQLTALTTFSDLVHEARELATQDALAAGLADDNVPLRDGGRGARAYGEAVSVYLAFAVDRATDFWSSLTRWVSVVESIVSTFGRQALPMVWDYPEANPFSDRSANWMACVERVLSSFGSLPRGKPGVAMQIDARKLHQHPKTLSTDPPYYDNIGYADLSDYFYVWMRSNLREVFPEVFTTLAAPKDDELIASTYRHGSKEKAKTFFEDGLRDTFSILRNLVYDSYPLSVYYAFKQQDAGYMTGGADENVASTGWETMLTSLMET